MEKNKLANIISFIKKKIDPIPKESKFLSEYKKKFHSMESYKFGDELKERLSNEKEYIVALKLDGMMLLLKYQDGIAALYSKKGVEYTGIPLLEEAQNILTDTCYLVGEVYAKDPSKLFKSFNESQSIVIAPKTKEDEDLISFYVYDIIQSTDIDEINSTAYLDRINTASGLLGKFGYHSHLNMMQYSKCTNFEDVEKIWNDNVLSGPMFEGLVIYIPSNKSFLKVKRTTTYDACVFAIEKGSGKYSETMGNLVVAFMDKSEDYLYCGVCGTGFTDEDREYWINYAKDNAIESDFKLTERAKKDKEIIFVNPSKVIEIETRGEFVNDLPAFKFKNNKFIKLNEDKKSVLFRMPSYIRERDDKDGLKYEDIRIEQVAIIAREAGYPSHPDKIIIDKNNVILSEDAIWNYYNDNKSKIIPFIKGRILALRLATDKNKETFVRHEPKDGEIIINSEEDYDRWNNGRVLSFGIEMKKKDDIVFIDLDPKENFPFNETKRIAEEIYNILNGTKLFKDIIAQYSGSDGFHLIAHFKDDVTEDKLKQSIDDMLD